MKLFENLFGNLSNLYDGLMAQINPASGLPMIDNVHDIHMNHYGTTDNEINSHDSWWSSSNSWDSSSSYDSSSSWGSNDSFGGF